MNRTILITGASKGIGESLAREYADRGYDLVIAARSLDRLEHLAAELRTACGVTVRVEVVDLARPPEIDAMVARVADAGIEIYGLVNNAGFGTAGPFETIEAEVEQEMISVNVAALTRLCHAYVGGFKRRGSGFVVNIASMAGLMPFPGLVTYAATKAFVVSLSRGLAEECRGTGVSVTCICPGTTRTDFQRRQGIMRPYEEIPGPSQSPAEVARFAILQAERGCALAVPGFANRLGKLAVDLLPGSVVARLLGRATRGLAISVAIESKSR